MKHNETVKTILEELSHIRVYKILYIYIYIYTFRTENVGKQSLCLDQFLESKLSDEARKNEWNLEEHVASISSNLIVCCFRVMQWSSTSGWTTHFQQTLLCAQPRWQRDKTLGNMSTHC